MQIASTENVGIARGATMPNAEPSAVAWGAVAAGAVVAMVTSLVLLVLGSGLGFVVANPWTADADTAKALGIGAIVWLVVMQLVSAALGGYVGGRLRTRWSATADEVYFRDTAHGLLVWAVATLVTAVLFSSGAMSAISGAASAVGGVAKAGAAATGLGAGAVLQQDNTGQGGASASVLPPRVSYYADLLLRSDKPATEPENPQVRAELGRVIASAMLRDGTLSQADSAYVSQTIASRTGMSQAEAEQRLNTVMAQAKQEMSEAADKARAAADQARKAAAHAALWLVVSLFIGAFVASYAGTIGGRMRDQP